MIGTPPSTAWTLYFIFNGTVYLPGDILLIINIGSIGYSRYIGSSLACVTTNVNTQCCRRSDGRAVGEWHFPDGFILPHSFLGGTFTTGKMCHTRRITNISKNFYFSSVTMPMELFASFRLEIILIVSHS